MKKPISYYLIRIIVALAVASVVAVVLLMYGATSWALIVLLPIVFIIALVLAFKPKLIPDVIASMFYG